MLSDAAADWIGLSHDALGCTGLESADGSVEEEILVTGLKPARADALLRHLPFKTGLSSRAYFAWLWPRGAARSDHLASHRGYTAAPRGSSAGRVAATPRPRLARCRNRGAPRCGRDARAYVRLLFPGVCIVRSCVSAFRESRRYSEASVAENQLIPKFPHTHTQPPRFESRGHGVRANNCSTSCSAAEQSQITAERA